MRKAVILMLAAGLGLGLVPAASAADGPDDMTPAVMACIRKALTPAQVQLIASGQPQKLPPASLAKAFTCVSTGGATSRAKVSTGAFITANPIDLGHVTAVSRFRSCKGHDYSGLDAALQMETDRSMKHYIFTDIPLTKVGALPGVAPFDGTVSVSREESGFGSQVSVTSAKLGWSFIFFHADPSVASGARVKAGQQVVSYPPASSTGAEPGQPHSFDFALRSADGRLDSFLAHASPAVVSAWAKKGFTPATAILSKADRDARPCNGSFNGSINNPDLIRATG